MAQDAAPQPHLHTTHDISITGSAVLGHNLGADPANPAAGWAVLMIGVRPCADPAAHLPSVTVTAEADNGDDPGVAVSIGVDRAGLDRLIGYLGEVRGQWPGAA